jgi:hypothetical protein
MAQINIETVGELQRRHKAPFWKVFDRSKRVEMNAQDQPIDLEQSIEYLNSFLESLSGDSCVVNLYTAAPEKTTAGSKAPKVFQLVVKLRNQETAKPSTIGAPVSLSEHLQLVEKIHELKMERLRAEMEREEKKESAMDRFLGTILQPETINGLVSMLTSKKTQPETVSGPEPAGNLSETLNRFKKVDPDFANTLAKMADYLEKNPGQLSAVKMVIGA